MNRCGQESRVGNDTRAAVGLGVSRLPGNSDLAVRSRISHTVGYQPDADNSGIRKAAELARIGDAVAICILPYPEQAEIIIGRSQHAVVVAVIIGGKCLQIGQAIARKDDLGSAGRTTIAVGIEYEQAVILADPGRCFGRSVVVEVEIRPCCGRDKFDTVAVKIERNRCSHCGD